MGYNDRPLDNPINWSFRAFRAFAIDVRVHVTFLIGAIVLIAMEMPDPDSAVGRSGWRIVTDALATYAMLFFIVLLHEFGHCFGARRTGGEADEILIWPLGGLAMVQPPHEPRAHMITTLAGPAVNVLLCALSGLLLILWTGTAGAMPWNPLHPGTPVDPLLQPTAGQWWVIRFFGVSYVLLLFNLLPIFPFDGGRVLQAWLWSRRGHRVATMAATSTGMVGAIVVGLVGLLVGEYLLLMIAVFGYLSCWQERRMAQEQAAFESEFSSFANPYDDVAEEPRRRPGWIARWRERRAEQRAQREAEAERKRQVLVEEALKQVSQSGLQSLTPAQRKALEEETRRKRMTP